MLLMMKRVVIIVLVMVLLMMVLMMMLVIMMLVTMLMVVMLMVVMMTNDYEHSFYIYLVWDTKSNIFSVAI